MKAVSVVVVVTAMFLAGCVSDNAGQKQAGEPAKIRAQPVDLTKYVEDRPLYSLGEIRPFLVQAKDGIRLNGHVYLPDAPGPFPTILEYSPYHNDDAIGTGPSDGHAVVVDGRRTMDNLYRHYMDAGYAVAIINLRGTGISEGCFQWGTPLDVEDVGMVIEKIAMQPWSDGQVGMIGTSYPGWTQYMALASGSPYLKAVIPVSGVQDLHSLLTRNGAAFFEGPVVMPAWELLFSIGKVTYPPVDSRGGGDVRHGECGPILTRDLQEGIKLMQYGDKTAYWQERDLRPLLAKSQVPIMYTNGLTDGEGHILQFEGLWELIPHQNKRALLGQWGHGGTDHPTVDWNTMEIAWFDQHMRPASEILIMPGIVEYQDDADQWHESTNWPPPRQDVPLYLSDGTLTDTQEGVRASTQIFQSIHANPCLGVCTKGLEDTPDFPVCGPFQAIYVSPPLKEDVLLAGNFHVNLTVTSTLPDGNLAAYLYHTTGSATCPDAEAREVRRALTDLRHPRPDALGADFPVNSPTSVDIRSHPFATPIKAGERLVLAIGGGALELDPEPRKPVLTITTGGENAGMITLPVVEGTLAFE